jgi:NitT/TauT family transport system substrate-binding protein
VGLRSGRVAAEPPPETTTLRLGQRVARVLVDKGIVKQYSSALQIVKELPYARWRDYGSEDTLRFYALRLHEAGMVKSSPQKLLAQGSDLRFVNELRKELKG